MTHLGLSGLPNSQRAHSDPKSEPQRAHSEFWRWPKRSEQAGHPASKENKVDDFCIVDGKRPTTGSWVGFARFTVLNTPPPKGHMWAGGRLTTIQTTSMLDDIWPDVLSQMVKKQKTLNEKRSSNEKETNPSSTLHAD